MGAAITFYPLNSVAGTSSHMAMQSGTAPNSLRTTTGWTIGTQAASKSSWLTALVTDPVGSFTANGLLPNAGTLGTTDAFRTTNTLFGTFANANWLMAFCYGDSSADTSARVRPRWRVYRSVNENGASATELTTTVLTGTQGALATNTGIVCVASFNPGLTTLTSEYLFFQLACAIDSAGGNVNRNVLVTIGASCSITTPLFGAIFNTAVADAPFMVEAFTGRHYRGAGTGGLSDAFIASVFSAVAGNDRVVLETAVFVEAMQRAWQGVQVTTDAAGFVDAVARAQTLRRDVGETEAFIDALANWAVRKQAVADGYLFADQSVRTTTMLRALLEAAVLADAQTRSAQSVRQSTDTFLLVEQSNFRAGVLRALAEQVLAADALQAVRVLLRTVTETVETQDGSPVSQAGVVRAVAETVAAIDLLARSVRAIRAATDAFGMSDASASALLAVRTDAGALGMAETLQVVVRLSRLLADVVELSELPPAAAAALFRVATELLGIVDGMASWAVRIRGVSETMSVTDALSAAVGLQRQLGEAAVLGDATLRTAAVSRLVADLLMLVDQFDTQTSHLYQIMERITLADSLLAMARLSRGLIETVDLSDVSPATAAMLFRATADLLGIADGLTSRLMRLRDTADAMGLADQISLSLTLASLQRLLAETVEFGDALSRTTGAPRILADLLALVDQLTARTERLHGITDGMGMTDTLWTMETVLRLLTAQAVLFAEGPSAMLTFARQFADTALLADASSASVISASILRLLSEALAMSDASGEMLRAWRTEAEALPLADSIARRGEVLRALGEAVAMAESVGRLVTALRVVPETAGIADLLTRVAALLRAVPDGVLLGEAATSAAMQYVRQLLEAALTVSRETGTAYAPAHVIAEVVALLDYFSRLTLGAREKVDAAGLAETWTVTVSRPGLIIVLPLRAQLSVATWFAPSAAIGAGYFQETLAMSDRFSPVAMIGAGLFQEWSGLVDWFSPTLMMVRD